MPHFSGQPVRYDVLQLGQAMAEQGITATEVAGRIGMSIATVTRTLRGERSSPHTIKLIADELGIRLADLVIVDKSGVSSARRRGRIFAPPGPLDRLGK